MACAYGEDALATGLAVDHDDMPDCSDLLRRGVRTYRFPVRWHRAIASTTFYHDEPAVDRVDDRGDGDDDGGLVVSVLGPRSVSFERDALDGADVAFWPHDDPRWHHVDAAAWQGLPMTRVLIEAAGMRHYTELMTRLHAHGIEPIPVLDPSDMPDALCRAVDGWRSPLAVEAYAQFVRAVLAHTGHLARTWVSVLPTCDAGTDGAADLDRRRSVRHMLLAQARAAGVYHRDLSGAGGAARGRFAVSIACHHRASDAGAATGDGEHADFDRIVEAFGHFCTPAPSREDGFAWGFTTAQRALLSRAVDAIVLDCTLEEDDGRWFCASCDEHGGIDNECASGRCDDGNTEATAPAASVRGLPVDGQAQALSSWIDRAAAALPGVPILVCDGTATDPGEEDRPMDMDTERGEIEPTFGQLPADGSGMHACLPDGVLDADDKEIDRDVSLDVDAVVKSLAARFAAAHRASLAGRPVEMYLVRPG
ncbi:Glycosyl hydrolase family 1 incomplete domain containing protein [Pandoravirus neocaledonia]|uniref:Glycosyl hydrolase family 1 incomplete domain containing protein n=1 Tax=Pandoravirus neocaledonia TaxID=2107708 RepID=A0A2U7UB45_9VIRU|nr:Glycosyl hydrolase family 1 incomplete domain containing protein [Pandoravirus neocaledonia]AVK75622.1 Glycosyl hydrolase family 1 incomplete domain containing protein [Pandoravirus neocaledonia]